MNHTGTFLISSLALACSISVQAQSLSKFILVDQFGYLPGDRKVTVIRDPVAGFDGGDSFLPGNLYSVVNAGTGERVYSGGIKSWKSGSTDGSSGDRAWHFDFSDVSETGTYYILDDEQSLRSYEFVVSPDVYNELLKQAVRTFFYQRSGFAKEAGYAGEAWADGASHVGNQQDLNCRSFFDRGNPDTEKDVSGGWYDAGDYNKYSNWTANYLTEMMKAYLEKPDAWADDYNIPESGNGIPDLLDEARWGIDHLLRMQQEDGSVLSVVGESHGSPPSSVDGPSYYGPPNTSATLNTAAAFAICSKVYRGLGMTDYADTLLARSLKAWEWGEAFPDSLFNNNDAAYNSQGLAAGGQEVNDYDRGMIKLEAACYLFEVTGDMAFRHYFDAHYQECHLMQWNWAYPFESANQDALLYYTLLENGTASVQNNIRNVYRNTLLNSADNLPSYASDRDPYMAFIKDYTWGSNSIKAAQGSMFYHLVSHGIEENEVAVDAARGMLHYLHGVNPLNMVYLSNMYAFGADNCVNEFYHSWFTDGSPAWDRVGESVWGPAPGFLTGGPNPGYDWDGCCPSGCGSASNNARCTSESISPPKGQPDQKSYKDFNTSWPLNSWSVTENSCGYQSSYIRLLSKFVNAYKDCNGDEYGTAYIDSCGNCAGGNTGVLPMLDSDLCSPPDALVDKVNAAPGIYPNPNRGQLKVAGYGHLPCQVKIIDLSGKVLIKSDFTGRAMIQTGALKPGFYEVSISSRRNVSRLKLIKL